MAEQINKDGNGYVMDGTNLPNLNINISTPSYETNNNLGTPKGADPSIIKNGKATNSVVNKLFLIKLANNFPAMEKDYSGSRDVFFSPKTFVDLCQISIGACQYEAEDFLYCKNLGFPINRLITLRRFPIPCTDNIYDTSVQEEPDIARMVTYFSQDVNKLEDILSFSYGLKWKELTAEMEQATMQGDQSGFSGFMKTMMTVIDPVLAKNKLMGENKLNYDPKFDQNKVYGPVDSISSTHIRDVGLEFSKEFEITFEYELRSIGGKSPEYAMKDVIANILACTYNNGKFWPGSRYWIGERPSQFYKNFDWMNPDTIDDFLFKAHKELKDAIGKFKEKGSALKMLKNIVRNGFAIAIGKLLDNVGRPSIAMMNSLLTAEPTGNWHLAIGNPENPIMVMGNLMCMGVDISFPTDSLSYGDFPTKLMAKVKLKPAQPKDKAGIEMMFNQGRHRIYYQPKSVPKASNKVIARKARGFFGFDSSAIDKTIDQAFDFVDPAQKIQVVTETVMEAIPPKVTTKIMEINEAALKTIKGASKISFTE